MTEIKEISALELAKEQAILKAKTLSEKEGVLVHHILFLGENETDFVVGFLKEPPFLVKARAMDRVYNGQGFTANLEILEICLLKDHSDARMLSESAGNGMYKLGAAKAAGDLLLIAKNQAEKKS
jgi:hypothetical protein